MLRQILPTSNIYKKHNYENSKENFNPDTVLGLKGLMALILQKKAELVLTQTKRTVIPPMA